MTDHNDAPWTRTGDRFANHYGDGRGPEHAEAEAAIDWYQNGSPQDGGRWGEYYVHGGELWNDGKYCAADGSAEPYQLWVTRDEDPAATYDDPGDELATDDAMGR